VEPLAILEAAPTAGRPRTDTATAARFAKRRLRAALAAGPDTAGTTSARTCRPSARTRRPAAWAAAPATWKYAAGEVRSRRLVALAVGRVGHRHCAAGARGNVERELPLVVASGATVAANGVFFALAAHAHHAAGNRLTSGRCRRTAAAPPLCRWRVDARLRTADADEDELTVLRHRVLVFLAQVASFHERVDARRKSVRDVCVLESKEGDRARVLLAAKHELGLFFPLRFVAPYRHRDRKQDGHDRQRDEQRGHGVSAFTIVPRQIA